VNRYNFARIGCYIILGEILKIIGLTLSDWEFYAIVVLTSLLVLFAFLEAKKEGNN
jgi:sulfite exporter TauE/SafE